MIYHVLHLTLPYFQAIGLHHYKSGRPFNFNVFAADFLLANMFNTFVFLCFNCRSNKQIRIESTTDLQVDQLTRLSRQNTSTSLGDVTWNNYHPPPKPDVSFEQSRRISQNFTRYK